MKKAFILGGLASLLMASNPVVAETVIVPVNQVSADGIGEKIGTVTFIDTPDGLNIDVDLTGLTPGQHGMHIHQNPSCQPALQDGKPAAALGAGGHWDPDGIRKHKGPANGGHRGDLPYLTANDQGISREKLQVKNLAASEIKGRSLMIHAGGDTYSDTPALGGGGARIACGVIE